MGHNARRGTTIPLAMLGENMEGVIVGIRGGRGLVRRLVEMGLTIGTRVRVLRSDFPGPVLIEVRGSRIALGRGVAMKVLVMVEEGS